MTETAAGLYLDLLKRSLTGALHEDNDLILGRGVNVPSVKGKVINAVAGVLQPHGVEMVRKRPYDPAQRERGLDWPPRAETMIGLKRIENIQHCVETVLADDVPGDLIETGVWRGGACIFMRGVLKAHGVTDRTVWAADSFEGLPPPDPHRYPADEGDLHHTRDPLRIGLDQVKHNFERYGLLDDQVRFLPGWFSDTLPGAPIDRVAVLRLDGDMYESTMDGLNALYPKLSPGGFCIVDDWLLEPCQRAVHDYRREHGIDEEIVDIDGMGVFWRRGQGPQDMTP